MVSQSKFVKILFLAPSEVILSAIGFFPLIFSFYASFFYYNIILTGLFKMVFVGARNYLTVLSDHTFINSLWVSMVFVTSTVVIEFFLGLSLAMILSEGFKGRDIVRTVIFTPIMMTPVVIGFAWRLIYNATYGLANYALKLIGLTPIDWVGNPNNALPAMVIVDVWQWTPFMVLLLLAGLQAIPIDLYESAEVDGASSWRKFINITLPMLKPAVLVALLFRSVDAFRVFDIIFMLTYGGPGGTTETISIWIYKFAFGQADIGTTSAASYIVFVALIPIVWAYVRFFYGKGGILNLLKGL